MAIEKGIVVAPDRPGDDTAWVEIVPPAACEACASRKSCGTGMSGQPRRMEVINRVGATVGDRVQVSIKTSALLKAIFLLYLFPILCMVGGGLAGHFASRIIDTNASTSSLISAIGCFIAAMAIVRIRGGRMALKSEYKPKITRILPGTPKTDGGPKPPGDCSLKAAAPH